MAGFVGFIEGLLPNYIATFLPSGDMVGGVIVLWCFIVFYVVRWWLRKAGKYWRAVIFPTVIIALSLAGLLAGSVWISKRLTNQIAGNDKAGPPQHALTVAAPQSAAEPPAIAMPDPFGDITKVSDGEILAITIRFAAQMRNFETRSSIEADKTEANFLATLSGPDMWNKRNRMSQELREHMELEFHNTYMHPAVRLRDEIRARLRHVGIFEVDEDRLPGLMIPRSAFEGGLFGPYPITKAADYLEGIARKLP